MDPLTVIGLAKYVPDIIGLFSKKRGKDAQKAIEAVGQVAEAVTGKTGSEAEAAIASDPNLAYQFQLAVMADSHVQAQLDLENLQSARATYQVNPSQVNKVADSIMTYNLVIVFLLVIINIAATIHLEDNGPLIAIVSNFIGIAIQALLNERQAVTGFFLGSSLGSKLKHKVNNNDR